MPVGRALNAIVDFFYEDLPSDDSERVRTRIPKAPANADEEPLGDGPMPVALVEAMGIEELRDTMGENWSPFATEARRLIHACINKYLNEGERAVLRDPDRTVILFTGANLADAERRARGIGTELNPLFWNLVPGMSGLGVFIQMINIAVDEDEDAVEVECVEGPVVHAEPEDASPDPTGDLRWGDGEAALETLTERGAEVWVGDGSATAVSGTSDPDYLDKWQGPVGLAPSEPLDPTDLPAGPTITEPSPVTQYRAADVERARNWAQGLAARYRPVLALDHDVVGIFQAVMDDDATGQLAAVAEAVSVEAEQLDLATVRAGVEALSAAVGNDIDTKLMLPVHFHTLTNPSHQKWMDGLFKRFNLPKAQVIVELICHDRGFHLGKVPAVTRFVRQHAGAVWARVAVADIRMNVIAQARVGIVGVDAQAYHGRFGAFAARARDLGMKTYIDGLSRQGEVGLAREHGFDFACGPLIGATFAELPPSYALRR